MINQEASEDEHEDVYGTTFALYTPAQLEQFVVPFEYRLTSNGLDPSTFFGGKYVLDAGCGGGRGSLLALRNGASRVDAVDISSTNIETTARVLEASGGNFGVHLASLAKLPFDDESFDVVWCNGVLMHTGDPSETLSEIIRVLKPAGSAWIYVYGCEGVYWRTIAAFRRSFARVPVADLIKVMRGKGVLADRVAEMVDDWKAPFLRTYDRTQWETALGELHCEYTRLWRGMPYDTSEQLVRGSDPEIVGQGDLRYLVVKRDSARPRLSETSQSTLTASNLDEFVFRSLNSESTEMEFASALSVFEARSAVDPMKAVPTAIRAQLYLRDFLLRTPTLESVRQLASLLVAANETEG